MSRWERVSVNDMHGISLPHASTTVPACARVINHTLRFTPPNERLKQILVLYVPASIDEFDALNDMENLPKAWHASVLPHAYHEALVPMLSIMHHWPQTKKSEWRLVNVQRQRVPAHMRAAFVVVSADWTHFLPLQRALKIENAAAVALQQGKLSHPAFTGAVDAAIAFREVRRLHRARYVWQWVGRGHSDPDESRGGGVGYLSFILREKPQLDYVLRNAVGFFVTAYDSAFKARECLGEYTVSQKALQQLIQDVVRKASGSHPRLQPNNPNFSNVPYITITPLYNARGKFIRGWHAVRACGSLYLKDVFLEHTYPNGTWISPNDQNWKNSGAWSMQPTLSKLKNKTHSSGAAPQCNRLELFSTDSICMRRDAYMKFSANNYRNG